MMMSISIHIQQPYVDGADITTLLSDTDDMIDELIDAELLSTEPSSSDLLTKQSSSSSSSADVNVNVDDSRDTIDNDDDSEEIILLDDDNHIVIDDSVDLPMNSTLTTDSSSSSSIHVQSNLQSLSDEELIAICTERGYEITIENSSSNKNNNDAAAPVVLTHDDYVQAATQCLSLDKVVDQMIAENPDIAADMDHEVERIRL